VGIEHLIAILGLASLEQWQIAGFGDDPHLLKLVRSGYGKPDL
jgi:hypothetical protein